MSSKRKLLLISDAISGSSGLARIARDVSTRIHANLSDVYDLAVAGYGSPGSCKFGFHQYHLEGVQSDWVLPSLPEIVNDFAGNERCTLLFISDPSRLGWFADPERLGGETLKAYPGLKDWLVKANIEKWIYCPLDSSGPNDRLTFPLGLTLMGFERILAYGQFGEGVIRRTIGDDNANQRHLTWLPHGIDTEEFYDTPRKTSRKLFIQYTGAQTLFTMLGQKNTDPIADDETLVAIIGTNQSRKNFQLGIETASILARTRKLRLWLHVDGLERYWSIPALLADYGMLERTVISLGCITDSKMAIAYSAADLVLGIAPEGFGYVHAEAMACGVPCVTGSYAGGAALVDPGMLVDPIGFYYEGSYACKRPVYRAEDWAKKAEEWIGKRTILDPKYDWEQNWIAWEKYLREAAK